MSLNDHELVEEARAGSRAAFDQLMRRHERFVFRIAYSYTGEADGAMDVCQDVFLRVHRKLDTFAGRSAFRTWLAHIARNEALSWLRGRRRRRDEVEVTEANAPSGHATQELTVVRDERSRDLLAEVHRLNPRQQQALLLRYFEKMPIREIGDVLDCSEGQVKSILFRGVRKLRENLSGQDRWNRELEA